jgi:type IV fimbrial biogenesis protein FimT
MERPRGLTLPELVFTLAICMGILGWSVPAFRDIRRNSARTTEVNRLVHDVYLARSEAIKRNGVVSLCPSLDRETCAATGTPWSHGWIVFVNLDRDSPAVREPGEPLLSVHEPWTGGTTTANRSTLSFRPFGQVGVTATFTFCDDRGSRAARAVIISQTGRPRVSDRSASSGPLSCIL